MRCVCCESNNWENVDQYRFKPSGMSICRSCGFVSYPAKWKSKEEIIKHYRKDYRPGPTSNNIFTGQRKIHFHKAFLNDVMKNWIFDNKVEPEICEIGAAFGMALDFFKQVVPGSKVYGTELTESYKRVAAWQYGINLQDDFDDTQKYDLIMSYKVAEHQLDVDREIARYATALKPGGFLYISVPTWFDQLTNFGAAGFDIEYYYDPNHINVWTRKHFESLLAKAGFEVVKQDHVMYDSTYLCKVGQNVVYLPHKENPTEMKEKMAKIKKVQEAMLKQKFNEAVAIWPNFPMGWSAVIEHERRMLADMPFSEWYEKIGKKALEATEGSIDIVLTVADFAMRAGDFEPAIKFCEQALRMRPENPPALMMLANIMRELAIKTEEPGKTHYFKQMAEIGKHLRMVSLQHQREGMDIMLNAQAQIPLN